MTFLRRTVSTAYYQATGRGHIVADVNRFEQLYRSSRTDVERAGRVRLASILSHASKTVPYYRDYLKGENISEATAESTLGRLPILTKQIITRHRARLISESPGTRVYENTSGGSTGEPVRLLQDREMGAESRSGELLFMRWAGHRQGDPHVLIWGVPNETFSQRVSFRERVFRFAQNETYFNCYQITDELLDQWIERLTSIRPKLIEAYVDAIHELSRRILSTGRRVPSPRGIITSAGVLTDAAREIIGQAFQCPVINRYGSREVGNVACSCSQAKELHVHEAWNRLEIVNDDGKPCAPSEEGQILVTLFANRTMPLIRYRIEDRGIWAEGECVCGRKTKRLAAVCGRQSDYLFAADGSKINGTALTTLLYDVRGIRRFQYRQLARNKVSLTITPLDGVSQLDLEKSLVGSLERLKQLLPGVDVHLDFDREILPSNSGKFRYIINEVPDLGGGNVPV